MQLPGVGSNAKKHVTFDEHQIHEHDKERGTRMTIPDPDTPFMRSPIMSDDEHEGDARMQQMNHQSMMADAANVALQSPTSSSDDSPSSSISLDFREKRKAFYNEFRVLKGVEKPQSPKINPQDTDGTI
jgi:hypothetical protein